MTIPHEFDPDGEGYCKVCDFNKAMHYRAQMVYYKRKLEANAERHN